MRRLAVQNVEHVKRLVPPPLVPPLVRRRLDQVWADPAYRAHAEASMEFLLGCSPRADEATALARAYAEQMLLRNYRRWRPRTISNQRVQGVEWLTTRRDPGRGVLLSFMHHGAYDGMFASVARHGPRLTVVAAPDLASDEAPSAMRQHLHVVGRRSNLVMATVGTDALADLLRQPGTILGLATDVPGRTPVTFLGRPVLGSFGAARLASMTDSVVVHVTTLRDEAGPYLQLHEPLDPRVISDPKDLLDEILRCHEPAVLAWPEAVESPLARFGAVEG